MSGYHLYQNHFCRQHVSEVLREHHEILIKNEFFKLESLKIYACLCFHEIIE